jgi:hypothetical protein
MVVRSKGHEEFVNSVVVPAVAHADEDAADRWPGAEQHQTPITRVLAHRARNTLTVVQAAPAFGPGWPGLVPGRPGRGRL